MQNWILDVLADIRKFADANNLPITAQGLDDLMKVAAPEIAAGVRPAAMPRENPSADG